MPYVDGFVLPVPTKKRAAYRRSARAAGFDGMRMPYAGFKVMVDA